jgi:hypothetical protein
MSLSLLQRIKHASRILLEGTLPVKRDTQLNDISAITPEEVAEAKTFFPREKFFIYGHARSGTTLLTRLVRLHPEVHCNYQAHFFTRAPLLQALVADPDVRSWLVRRSNRWNRGRDLSPVVLRAVADFILERDAQLVNKRIVGDKSPNSLLNGQAVTLLHNIYPDARLVFIVRDGRDAALSHRFQQFIDVTQHLSKADWCIREQYSTNPEPYLHGERSLFMEKSIRQAAAGWVQNITETDQMGRQLFAEHYLSLRYEDMIKNPQTEIKRIWEFLGADISDPVLDEILAAEMQQNPDADWQHEKAGEIVAPLQKGKQGSWRMLFTSRDREVFKQIAGEMLIKWGYEVGLDW